MIKKIKFCTVLILVCCISTAQTQKRSPEKKDVANIFFDPRYTLYDYLTDEPIFPTKGGIYNIYIASNESLNPTKISGSSKIVQSYNTYKFKSLANWKKWSEIKNRETSNSNQSNSYKQEQPQQGQKFCFDDTYGSTGMKFEITLYENGSALLEFKRDGDVKRSGSGKWKEEPGLNSNSRIYLYLSNSTLKFDAVKNISKKPIVLLDSDHNTYVQCF